MFPILDTNLWYALTCMAELCWVEGWISKTKGLWERPWKNSGPLDYFRIEGQNSEGFWSISQLFFYRLWTKRLNVPNVKLFYIIKSLFFRLLHTEFLKIVQKLTKKCWKPAKFWSSILKWSKGLEFFQGCSHRPLALLIHPSTQQSSAIQVRAY